MDIEVINYFVGVFETLLKIAIALILITRPKELKKALRKVPAKVIGCAIVASLALSVAISALTTSTPVTGGWLGVAVSTVILAPIFEEVLLRGILYQSLLDISKKSRLTFGSALWLAVRGSVTLTVVGALLYYLGLVTDPLSYFPAVIFSTAILIIWYLRFMNITYRDQLSLITATVFQAVLFAFIHQGPTWSHIATGILYGILYYRTGSIWPGVAAHSVGNIYVNFALPFLKSL